MLYPLCPDLLAPHGTTSHQGLQGFSIHSAKTVSSLPLASIHIPAVKRHTLPTTATQRLDHASTPVNRSFALTAVSWPTSYSCLAPQTVESCWKNRQNGKSDNAVTQQIFRGAFFFAYSAICQEKHNACILAVPASQLNGFSPEGFLKQQSPWPIIH